MTAPASPTLTGLGAGPIDSHCHLADEAFKSDITFDAPGGMVKLDPKTQHTVKAFYMGKTRDDKQFDVIYKTKPIEPVPYPQVAFPGKSCDWTK